MLDIDRVTEPGKHVPRDLADAELVIDDKYVLSSVREPLASLPRRQGRGGTGAGEVDRKRGSPSHLALQVDESPVALDNAVDDGKSEPRARVLCREERFEHPVLDCSLDAVPCIAYRDQHELARFYR